VTREHVERYQHWIQRTPSAYGRQAGYARMTQRLSAVRLFFGWLARNHHILFSPAAEIELPKKPRRRLPKQVLTAEQVDAVLELANAETPLGIRDRAILETLYSTGIRRKELTRLAVHDVDAHRSVLTVRDGKGSKDRVVPIGARALVWLNKYVREVRPVLCREPESRVMFFTVWGKPMKTHYLGALVRDYLDRACLGHVGVCCHVFRHSMATLMLENGADVRYLQEILGHANLQTTEQYTHVAINKLKQVHMATHPAHFPQEIAKELLADDDGADGCSALNGVATDPCASRLPGYPGKRRREKVIREHAPFEWKERLVRAPGRGDSTDAGEDDKQQEQGDAAACQSSCSLDER